MKKALITGINGQDGYYLAKHLFLLGYEVIGGTRRANLQQQEGVNRFVYCDVRDYTSVDLAIRKADPDEIYNLAGQSFVPPSWNRPEYTIDVNTNGLARILEVVEKVKPTCRVYQASSSEMFGNYLGVADEDTPMRPVSPYGVSKYAAHNLVRVYRQKGLYVVSGILFNHESPMRGPEMVSRKIIRTVAQWKEGKDVELRLGNIKAKRDWGFAGDYVKAMYLMLQQPKPDDFVIGTGVSHTVEELVEEAIFQAQISPHRRKIFVDDTYKRPNELHALFADATKAREILGWKPEVSFEGLVKMMLAAELPTKQAACV